MRIHLAKRESYPEDSKYYYQAINPPGGDGEEVRVHPRGAAEEPCDADGGGVDGVQRHHHQRHQQVGEEHGEQEQVELRVKGSVCQSVASRYVTK